MFSILPLHFTIYHYICHLTIAFTILTLYLPFSHQSIHFTITFTIFTLLLLFTITFSLLPLPFLFYNQICPFTIKFVICAITFVILSSSHSVNLITYIPRSFNMLLQHDASLKFKRSISNWKYIFLCSFLENFIVFRILCPQYSQYSSIAAHLYRSKSSLHVRVRDQILPRFKILFSFFFFKLYFTTCLKMPSRS